MNKIYVYMLAGLVVFASCQSDKKAEVPEGPEVWLGLHLNMERDSALLRLAELKAAGTVTASRTSLPYATELQQYSHPVILSLKPLFEAGKLHGLEYQMAYQGWAPVNLDRYSDRLMVEHILVLSDRYDLQLNATEGKKGRSAFKGRNESGQIEVEVAQMNDQYIHGTINYVQ